MTGFLSTLKRLLLFGLERYERIESDGSSKYRFDEIVAIKSERRSVPVGRTESGGGDGAIELLSRDALNVEL